METDLFIVEGTEGVWDRESLELAKRNHNCILKTTKDKRQRAYSIDMLKRLEEAKPKGAE